MKIHLIEPAHDATVQQLTDEQLDFLASHGSNKGEQEPPEKIDWLHLYRRGEEQSLPRPIELSWKTDEPVPEDASISLWLSKNKNFSTVRKISCSQAPYLLYNPWIGTTYYWKVLIFHQDTLLASSETRHFTVCEQPPRAIAADGLGNIRDIGGYLTKDGKKVRQGLFYRGCEMEFHLTITEDGKRVLRDDLKVKTDLDLRIDAIGAGREH